MKHWAAGAALMCAVCLAGCSGSGLGDRAMVRAMYIEYSGQYEARLVILEAEPSADTGEASEQMRCISGSGNTVYEAIQNAEQGESRRLFYGQNELLFLGPRLMGSGPFDACRYLASDTSGRPNMAVYSLDTDPAGFEQLQENGAEFLGSVQRLEERGVFRTYLYQFGAPGGSAVIPGLKTEDGSAALEKLTLFRQGRADVVWQGAEAQLARLLAGQADALELTLEDPAVSFQVRSPKLRFDPTFAGDAMELTIHFSGTVQRLVGPKGAALPGQDRALEQAIDSRVRQLLEKLVCDTLGRGNDVFQLRSRFANLDEGVCGAMEEEGLFSRPGAVKFDCLLRMV